jgi:hypothetical protein
MVGLLSRLSRLYARGAYPRSGSSDCEGLGHKAESLNHSENSKFTTRGQWPPYGYHVAGGKDPAIATLLSCLGMESNRRRNTRPST